MRSYNSEWTRQQVNQYDTMGCTFQQPIPPSVEKLQCGLLCDSAPPPCPATKVSEQGARCRQQSYSAARSERVRVITQVRVRVCEACILEPVDQLAHAARGRLLLRGAPTVQ